VSAFSVARGKIIGMITHVFTLKNAFLILLATLLLAGSLGIPHMGMSMDMEGNMIDCPFMPGVSICTMSPLEMIAASLNFLSTITPVFGHPLNFQNPNGLNTAFSIVF
jgi:hypothetical protein